MTPPFTIHHSPFTEFVTFAHALADAAGDIIRPYFEAELTVENKEDKTPVTKADREAEAAMRALIEAQFPDHAIYGEEGGQKKTISKYTWVLDPIDGTKAFIAKRKEWGTLIALCENGVPILGLLDQPVTGERWIGVRGAPTQYSTIPVQDTHTRVRAQEVVIKTRACASLAEAELSTTSASYFTPVQAAKIVKLAQSVRNVVKDGDCYAYGLLAKGSRDIVVDAGLKPYDILALVPIIEGAGGCVTHWDGAAITLNHNNNVIAIGDHALQPEILKFLGS